VSLLLGPDETLTGGIDETARDFEEQTALYWRHWSRRLAVPLEWQDAVIRAAITLKLCQYEDTGAIVAAMTTSIPEAPHSGRNWDYRYCWLRDAFFVVRALNSLAEVGTMESYLKLAVQRGARREGGPCAAAVRHRAGAHCPNRSAPRCRATAAWARCAWATRRRSISSTTSTATSCWAPRRPSTTSGCSAARQRRLCRARGGGRAGLGLHDQPDAGMWELRTRARVHTSSALMCWAACDRLAKIAAGAGPARARRYWANARGRHPRADPAAKPGATSAAAFVESLGGRDLDASVLLMAEVGFLPPHDPRFVSTVEALEKSLCDGPFMRRYEAEDDFGKPETAFNVCSFWRVDALARIGRRDEAREAFEALLASATRWACSARTRTRHTASCGATFRRPIRWWASSTARCGCRRPGTAWCEVRDGTRRCSAACASRLADTGAVMKRTA
jgi:hypothetical protein